MVPFWGSAPPSLVYFGGDWDVHWRYNLTHGHMTKRRELPWVAGWEERMQKLEGEVKRRTRRARRSLWICCFCLSGTICLSLCGFFILTFEPARSTLFAGRVIVAKFWGTPTLTKAKQSPTCRPGALVNLRSSAKMMGFWQSRLVEWHSDAWTSADLSCNA